jgi:FkbM family methyltransferase
MENITMKSIFYIFKLLGSHEGRQKITRKIKIIFNPIKNILIKTFIRTKGKELRLLQKKLSLRYNEILWDDKFSLNSTDKQYLAWRYKDFSLINISKNNISELLRGLDEESITTVNIILSRLDKICKVIRSTINPDIKFKLDIFTQKEKEYIKYLKETFFMNILKIKDNCFYYDHYFLPVNGFTVSVFISKHEIHLIQNMDKIKNKDIIDVGGWIGDSALILSQFTNKCVYSFEAVKQNYENILKTIDFNNLNNVKPILSALGSHEGVIYIEDSNSGSFTIDKETKKSETVKLDTLDNFVNQYDLDIGLIKVDIEGAECDFLKGAVNTIKKFKPVLLLSIYHSIDDFFNIKPLIESWNLGYSFKIRKPIDGGIISETLLIAEALT